MRLLLLAAAVVAVVATVDAVRGDHWDQVAMLAVIGTLLVAAFARLAAEGDALRPRRDLMRWVDSRAAQTDDEPRRIVDRALAAYRAALVADDDPD